MNINLYIIDKKHKMIYLIQFVYKLLNDIIIFDNYFKLFH